MRFEMGGSPNSSRFGRATRVAAIRLCDRKATKLAFAAAFALAFAIAITVAAVAAAAAAAAAAAIIRGAAASRSQ